VSAVEWYLGTHHVNGEIAEAMRAQRLIIGMTEREAKAAMERYTAHNRTQAKSSMSIEWSLWDPQTGQDVPCCSATIKDGRVVARHDLR
jgi:hypothetical protein